MRGLTATPKTTLRQAQGRLCGTDSIVIETGDGVGVRDEKTHPAKEGRVGHPHCGSRDERAPPAAAGQKKAVKGHGRCGPPAGMGKMANVL
jgi:hypothetical protein